MSPRHLRRWLVAIVLIVGIAAAGGGRPGSSASAPLGGDPRSAAIAVSAAGWSGTEGILPAQPQIKAAAYGRGVRAKLPVLVGAVAAALLAALMPHRRGYRRQQSSRLPFALRARSLPLRAPPLLPLV